MTFWPSLNRKKLWESVPASLRKVAAPIVGAVSPGLLLGRQFRRRLSFIKESQRWSAERARTYQLEELQRICRLAYDRAPFYRRRFDQLGFHPRDLTSLGDIISLPTIDRDTLRDHLLEMCAVPPDSPLADHASTGGTSGRPVRFLIDKERSAIEYAYLVASWRRAGYELGMPLGVLRGRAVRADADGFYHEYDPVLRHHYYSTFHMADDDVKRYLEHISSLESCFLHVYPSVAAALGRFVRRSGIRPPSNIRGIIAESEIVYADQRRMVEDVLGVKYFACYGHSEKCVLAAECEHSADYHVWPTYGYFELLDADDQPVTTPGERGEIVGTSFINTVMPFIRYRTGDFATYVGECCQACGREHTIIRDIRGHRTQEVLIATDGSEIPWAALNMHDDTFANVRQFQFFQDAPGRALLRLVPAEGFSAEHRRRILRNLVRKLDGQIALQIQLTDSIPLSPNAKTVYVRQEISP